MSEVPLYAKVDILRPRYTHVKFWSGILRLLPDRRGIQKLTFWVRGTNLLTLERNRTASNRAAWGTGGLFSS